ncbi:PAS domain S-box protein [Halomicroarcula sp. F27]|uniref:PAS domain S-box protein n=1 Tax=Haloarcula nitratireducens TaxID=2487749 RepID=A0AAW4PI61_9EURY|nr:PAS domain S-box protein [Halomicroarcula nitratireducens]
MDAITTVHDRYPLLPMLAYSTTTDGTVAIEATQRGATEYVSGEHLDATAETLTDRLAAVCNREDTATVHPRATVRQLEALVDHPASFAGILDPDGIIRFANAPSLEFINADADAIEGRPFWDTPWWSHSESLQERLRDSIERAAAGESVSMQADHYSPDGDQRIVQLGLEPVRDETGTVVAIAAEGQDVTEREQLTTELRENQTALERLYRVSSDTERSLEEKFQQLLELGCERLNLDIGFLSTIDIDGDEFKIVEARGAHEQIQSGARSPLSETYCRRAIEADGLLGVQDAKSEGWVGDPAYERFDLGCYLGGKIIVDGDLYGTLCFADQETRKISFSPAERTLVELITEWVSHELEHREYERELEAAQERLEETLERIDDAFFSVDAAGEFTYINSRAEGLLERSAKELIGNNIWEEFAEVTELPFFDEYQRAIETQEPVTFEAEYEPLDVWFEVNAYPSEDGLSVFFRDVTERRERERILNELLETSRDLMQASTRDEIADIVVQAAEEVLGEKITLVRMYDPDEEALVPVASTDTVDEQMEERPLYESGEGPVGRVFDRMEPEIYAEAAAIDDDRDRSPVQSVMYLPIDDHGILSIGALERDAFDTTDQQYAELLAATAGAALSRSERQRDLRKYEAILETVQEMVYVLDREGNFTLVSEPLADWLGYSVDELIGRPVSFVLTDDAVAEGRQLLEELRSRPNETSREYEAEGITRTGDRVPVEIELTPFPEDSEFIGSVGAVRDLRDLVSAREDVVEERDRFSYLFENLPDPIEEVEFEGERAVIRNVNPTFERLFDTDAETLVGESRKTLLDSPDHRYPGPADVQYSDGGSDLMEFTANTPTGRRNFLFRQISYQTASGERGFGIYTDITRLKRRERHLQVLHRILRHNLRNDLNIVHGFADQLVTELEETETQAYARRIRETADKLVNLSKTAQEIERIIDREVTTESIDPESVVTDLIEEYREAYPDAEIELHQVEAVGVYADRRLRTALEHLLENALEYTEDVTPHVQISIATDDNAPEWVRVDIEDNGSGIPDREWNVIVGDREITQLEHGTGLGLWLVKWLVDAYGGDLDYTESDLGGSTVTMWLRKAPDSVEGVDRDRSG